MNKIILFMIISAVMLGMNGCGISNKGVSKNSTFATDGTGKLPSEDKKSTPKKADAGDKKLDEAAKKRDLKTPILKNGDTKLKPEEKVAPKKKKRFSDTTVIEYSSKTVEKSMPLTGELPEQYEKSAFEKAVELFDGEQYNEACSKFQELSTQFRPPDSMFYEIAFYVADCFIYKEDYRTAEISLKKILIDRKAPSTVLEKVFVRLGQLFCVLKRTKDANLMFSKLKRDFPHSDYLKLANCESIKK
ncbi:MAG: hypothetical protein HW421_337 [Ignavibacteria bacterium]|nr:hypothetical protein [Ignavibacteria bacterium]